MHPTWNFVSQPSLPKMDEMGGAISHADLALGTVVPLLSSSPSPTQSRMRLVARQMCSSPLTTCLQCSLRELGECPLLKSNWTLHSNADLPPPGRALTEHNIYRLLAEVSLLVRAKAAVVTKTSNVGSLVQISALRSVSSPPTRSGWLTPTPGSLCCRASF